MAAGQVSVVLLLGLSCDATTWTEGHAEVDLATGWPADKNVVVVPKEFETFWTRSFG